MYVLHHNNYMLISYLFKYSRVLKERERTGSEAVEKANTVSFKNGVLDFAFSLSWFNLVFNFGPYLGSCPEGMT